MPVNVIIRPYCSGDCQEMAQLFYETVHRVNCAHYTTDQLDAWATGQVDLAAWDHSFQVHLTLVAQIGGEIVGFGDLDVETGYLDRLYVHYAYQRQGIATALCDQLERPCDGRIITTHASITARPFFEGRGYQVVRQQQVERRGVILTNFLMERPGDVR